MKLLENFIYKLRMKHYEKSKKRFLFKRGYVQSEAEYEAFQHFYECSNKETDFVEFVMTHRLVWKNDGYIGDVPVSVLGIEEVPEMIQGFKDIRKRITE